MDKQLILKVEQVSKEYRLGQIGGTTLKEELQRLGARLRHREDPTRKIGSKTPPSGKVFQALADVSFEVNAGERVGIIGRNGAGKSTLLKLISRITAPTTGWIGLNGRVASMLEVGTGFHWELTGRENIYLSGAILGMTKSEIDDKMEDIIDFSECRQFIDTPVKRYSSGMYVKLAFSVAAHLNSEIMIMDEVLAVGDMAFQQKCLTRMQEEATRRNRTILYVSHNMNTIRQLCDRCLLLEHGRLVFDGDVEQAIERYASAPANRQVAIDYTTSPTPNRWATNRVRTLRVAFVNKKNNVFGSNEPVVLQFDWLNEKEVEHLGLRVEIRDLAGKRIGAALLRKFHSGSPGENCSLRVALNVASLVSGSYQMVYVFFNEDRNGNTANVECVHGLCFEIRKDDGVIWQTQHWGNVHLPDLKLLEISMSRH